MRIDLKQRIEESLLGLIFKCTYDPIAVTGEYRETFLVEKFLGKKVLILDKTDNGLIVKSISDVDRITPLSVTIKGIGATEEDAIKDIINNMDKVCIHLLIEAAQIDSTIIPIDLSNTFTFSEEFFWQLSNEVEKWRLLVDKYIKSWNFSIGKDYRENNTFFSIKLDDIKEIGPAYLLTHTPYKPQQFGLPFIFALAEPAFLGACRIGSGFLSSEEQITITCDIAPAIINCRAVSCALDIKHLNISPSKEALNLI